MMQYRIHTYVRRSAMSNDHDPESSERGPLATAQQNLPFAKCPGGHLALGVSGVWHTLALGRDLHAASQQHEITCIKRQGMADGTEWFPWWPERLLPRLGKMWRCELWVASRAGNTVRSGEDVSCVRAARVRVAETAQPASAACK